MIQSLSFRPGTTAPSHPALRFGLRASGQTTQPAMRSTRIPLKTLLSAAFLALTPAAAQSAQIDPPKQDHSSLFSTKATEQEIANISNQLIAMTEAFRTLENGLRIDMADVIASQPDLLRRLAEHPDFAPAGDLLRKYAKEFEQRAKERPDLQWDSAKDDGQREKLLAWAGSVFASDNTLRLELIERGLWEKFAGIQEQPPFNDVADARIAVNEKHAAADMKDYKAQLALRIERNGLMARLIQLKGGLPI